MSFDLDHLLGGAAVFGVLYVWARLAKGNPFRGRRGPSDPWTDLPTRGLNSVPAPGGSSPPNSGGPDIGGTGLS